MSVPINSVFIVIFLRAILSYLRHWQMWMWEELTIPLVETAASLETKFQNPKHRGNNDRTRENVPSL